MNKQIVIAANKVIAAADSHRADKARSIYRTNRTNRNEIVWGEAGESLFSRASSEARLAVISSDCKSAHCATITAAGACTCTCPDFERRGECCKHQIALAGMVVQAHKEHVREMEALCAAALAGDLPVTDPRTTEEKEADASFSCLN